MTGGAMRIRLAILIAAAFLALPASGQSPATPSEPDIWPEEAASDDDVARRGRHQLPFTQQQIETLGRLLRQSQRATARGEGPAPDGRVRRVVLAAAGDNRIPTIAVRRGYATVVSVTDVTGAPWPIEEAALNELFLSATDRPAHSGHLLYLAPRAAFLRGNVAIKLRNLAEPVVAAIEEGGPVADFRLDLRLGFPGPNVDASAAARPESFRAGDDALLGVLTGRPPPAAARLAVDGGDPAARAWRLGGELLLVTRAHLLSPGPRAAERGAGGRWAYRLPDTPFALVTHGGRPERLAFSTLHSSVPAADVKQGKEQ